MSGASGERAGRVIEPEWLDGLAPDDPGALANRRDLRWLNTLAGSFRWLRRELRRGLPAGGRVLELGAGDGVLATKVRAGWGSGLHWTGLDRQNALAPHPATDAWIQADLLDFDGFDEFDAVVVNLLLHQFSEAELRCIGDRLASAGRLRHLWILEPLRSRRAAWAFLAAAKMLRFHPVSLHDGPVSIRAGFRPGELPPLLDPADRWRWTERATPLGILRVRAVPL